MNNAVFGKTMENVRNHVDVKLLTKWDERYGAKAMIAKPNFHSRSVFAENLIAVELRTLEIKFNKPIYRYGPDVLAQRIDDGEYVVMTSVEIRVRTHLDDVSLPQIVVSPNYDTSSRKISPRRSVQFLNESSPLGANIFFTSISSHDVSTMFNSK
ncbi:uncharacterized protein LOC112552215 [Pogonomyrmex barbatus]|uniref:Uncharacterized protein LOC112552215 n=1 Tax=Pogonomyrmex barbatus TaxID=144034 RepID=A0A8N1S1Z7_9HYME|nr:uncharacterized protein LOC112552215 [Pogonomyrmex barbatus]